MRRAPFALAVLFALPGFAAPAAALACAEADGTVAGRLGRAELTAFERGMVAERFASDFAEAARVGVASDALFGFARCELNGAAPEELVVVGRSPAHCIGMDREARPICGVWVLAVTPEGWVEVLESAGAPRLGTGTTNGWTDLVLERDGPPAAMKFGGVVYMADLGDADPLPEALEGWDRMAGAVDWYDFDDVMPAAAEAAFLAFYRREFRDSGFGALPDAFRVGVAELDGAAPEEVILQGISPRFCGPEGCRHWLLRLGGAAGPELLGQVVGFDLRAAATGGVGGRDLVLEDGEGLAVWRNDGAGWVRRAAP